MYSGKNKGSLATTPSGKISYSQTSETLSGTASTISLLQENNNVNKKIKKILTHTTLIPLTRRPKHLLRMLRRLTNLQKCLAMQRITLRQKAKK